MKLKVISKTPNVDAVVDWVSEDEAIVTVSCVTQRRLGDTERGEAVKIGDREYIVLAHMGDGVAVITKEFAATMRFGDDGDYRTSDVRNYCIGEFYQELSKVVGKDNIISHEIDLTADNGTGKGVCITDPISILTTERYRRYVEYLPAYGAWWWTATRVDVRDPDYARGVCYVGSRGVLDWNDSGYSYGVRPFCILNSSISVS